MVGGEGGDSLEGAFRSDFHSCSMFYVAGSYHSLEGASDLIPFPSDTFLINVLCVWMKRVILLKQTRKQKNEKCVVKTGEGAAATKSLGLVSILLPHGLGQRCG